MRPLVMGVLNVTPDSFSDGGNFMDHDRAIEHGLELVAAGRRCGRCRWRVEPPRRGARERGGGAEAGPTRGGRPLLMVRVSVDTTKPSGGHRIDRARAPPW